MRPQAGKSTTARISAVIQELAVESFSSEYRRIPNKRRWTEGRGIKFRHHAGGPILGPRRGGRDGSETLESNLRGGTFYGVNGAEIVLLISSGLLLPSREMRQSLTICRCSSAFRLERNSRISSGTSSSVGRGIEVGAGFGSFRRFLKLSVEALSCERSAADSGNGENAANSTGEKGKENGIAVSLKAAMVVDDFVCRFVG